MQVSFLAQPYNGQQLGDELLAVLSLHKRPSSVTFVSAFVAQQALRRLKKRLHDLHAAGTVVRFVIGVDMGGTSREVLQELATWPIDVYVYKNRRGRVTFHPKIYLVENENTADLFVGSNNLTDGGLYTNYEGTAHINYSLPTDAKELARTKKDLGQFLAPTAPIAKKLDCAYLEQLIALPEIPSEEQARMRKAQAGRQSSGSAARTIFGTETLPSAPALPKEVLDAVLHAVASQIDAQKRATKEAAKAAKGGKRAKLQKLTAKTGPASALARNVLATPASAQLLPTAFYMELVKTGTGGNIPGEQRIPLEAVAAARGFWHWPYAYTRKVNPRKKASRPGSENRVYYNYYSTWRIQEAGNPANDETKNVRLYFYENSSDFRFYARAIAVWGAAGDIVRIAPSDEPGVDYDCQLAKKHSPKHAAWMALCTQTSRHTARRFGFE